MTYWYLLGIAALCVIVVVLAVRFFQDIMDDVAAMLVVFAAVVCGLGALICGAGFIVCNIDRAACLEHGEEAQVVVNYELISGCYIMVDGRFIPYDRWVQVSGTNAP